MQNGARLFTSVFHRCSSTRENTILWFHLAIRGKPQRNPTKNEKRIGKYVTQKRNARNRIRIIELGFVNVGLYFYLLLFIYSNANTYANLSKLGGKQRKICKPTNNNKPNERTQQLLGLVDAPRVEGDETALPYRHTVGKLHCRKVARYCNTLLLTCVEL